MCIVCQNVPAVMTGLSGAGLLVRTAVRRARAPRAGQRAAGPGNDAPVRSRAPRGMPAAPGTVVAPAPVRSR